MRKTGNGKNQSPERKKAYWTYVVRAGTNRRLTITLDCYLDNNLLSIAARADLRGVRPVIDNAEVIGHRLSLSSVAKNMRPLRQPQGCDEKYELTRLELTSV